MILEMVKWELKELIVKVCEVDEKGKSSSQNLTARLIKKKI